MQFRQVIPLAWLDISFFISHNRVLDLKFCLIMYFRDRSTIMQRVSNRLCNIVLPWVNLKVKAIFFGNFDICIVLVVPWSDEIRWVESKCFLQDPTISQQISSRHLRLFAPVWLRGLWAPLVPSIVRRTLTRCIHFSGNKLRLDTSLTTVKEWSRV